MKGIKTLLALCAFVCATTLQAQIFEKTYNWGAFDHSAWKVAPQPGQGYVLVGGKFFEPQNTNIYIQRFDEFGTAGWLRTHSTSVHSFTQLQTFWKSYCVSTYPPGYFIVSQGTRGGQNSYYSLIVNNTGQKIYERFGSLPDGIEFGGVCPASNGGYIATGSNNSGNLVAVKFNQYGEYQWRQTYPVSGFGWTIQPANGGGYVIGSTGHRATRIDHLGNWQWSTAATPPLSQDGSAFTYSEFEEIVALPNGQGFIMTGSTFSNSTSAVYLARFTWSGGVSWVRVPEQSNTSLAGTPVSWTNSPIVNGSNEIITSWRTGPVSAGGTLRARRYDFAGTATTPNVSLGNTIPVQEAFLIKPHGKFVIGGTRGGYSAAYSWISTSIPTVAPQQVDDTSVPESETMFSGRIIVNGFNGMPEFGKPEVNPAEFNPATRVFQTELRVYPNPSDGGFVNVGGLLEPGAQLRVVSMTGQVVAQQVIPEGENLIRLDLAHAAKGLYLVEMVGEKNTVTKKVVVQ